MKLKRILVIENGQVFIFDDEKVLTEADFKGLPKFLLSNINAAIAAYNAYKPNDDSFVNKVKRGELSIAEFDAWWDAEQGSFQSEDGFEFDPIEAAYAIGVTPDEALKLWDIDSDVESILKSYLE
jgi:hypothetical protein